MEVNNMEVNNMEKCDLKNIMEDVFKQAYQLGKQDMLEGIHISSDVLFKHFIENNFFEFESHLPLLKSSIS
jgi:hypothetical protein